MYYLALSWYFVFLYIIVCITYLNIILGHEVNHDLIEYIKYIYNERNLQKTNYN